MCYPCDVHLTHVVPVFMRKPDRSAYASVGSRIETDASLGVGDQADGASSKGLGNLFVSPGRPRVVVTTGIPTSPCTTPYGDLLLALQLQNKADWARLHGYELHAMAEEVHAGLRPGPWQKVAFLQKVRNPGRVGKRP